MKLYMHLQTSVKIILSIFVFAVIAGYSVFRTFEYTEGPTLSITSPKNGATLEKELVRVTGKAGNIASISLNGSEISTDLSGEFSENLLLKPGYNVFEVKVSDRFGRVQRKILQLVYRPDEYSRDGSALTQSQSDSDPASL